MINLVPELKNSVSEYLATDADDAELEGLLKNALSDDVGGAVFESVFMGIRALKNARRSRREFEAYTADSRAAVDLDTVKLAADEVPAPHTPEGTPSVSPEVAPTAAPESPALRPEGDTTARALDEKTPAYGDMADDEAQVALRERFGITDEKLAELRGRIQRGEVKPEQVSELIGLNGSRMDWSRVRNVEDAIGLVYLVAYCMECRARHGPKECHRLTSSRGARCPCVEKRRRHLPVGC